MGMALADFETEAAGGREQKTGLNSISIGGPRQPENTFVPPTPEAAWPDWLNELCPRPPEAPRRLAVPIRLRYARDPDDRGVVVTAPIFNISGSAETAEGAIQDLSETLLFLRRDLAAESDESLSGDAISLKRRLLRIIP